MAPPQWAMSEADRLILPIIALLLAVLLYLLPTLVAWRRGHHNRLAICVLNIGLGWTLLGWMVALVWAVTRPAPDARG